MQVKFEVHTFNHIGAIKIYVRKFRGSHDPGHAPFSKKNSRGHVQTIPGNTLVEFEIHTFNHIGAIKI